MFNPVILKPRPEARKSEELMLLNESIFRLGILENTSLG